MLQELAMKHLLKLTDEWVKYFSSYTDFGGGYLVMPCSEYGITYGYKTLTFHESVRDVADMLLSPK